MWGKCAWKGVPNMQGNWARYKKSFRPGAVLITVPGLLVQLLVVDGKYVDSSLVTGAAEERWIQAEIDAAMDITTLWTQQVRNTRFLPYKEVVSKWMLPLQRCGPLILLQAPCTMRDVQLKPSLPSFKSFFLPSVKNTLSCEVGLNIFVFVFLPVYGSTVWSSPELCYELSGCSVVDSD